MTKQRVANISRTTRETDIRVKLDLDGSGKSKIDSGVPFMDHMLELFAKHGFFDLEVKGVGDTHIDYHHTMEEYFLAKKRFFTDVMGGGAAIVNGDDPWGARRLD